MIFAILACSLPAIGMTDEVDEVLAAKAKGRDKIQRLSGEWTVETRQPDAGGKIKNPKSLTLRYRLTMDRLPSHQVKHRHQPWRIVAEVLEPHPMTLKVEGEQAWFLDQRGNWNEMPLTPEIREQFGAMSERFMGADAIEQRKHFDIKILRKNNPIFGPKTTTVSFTPKGKHLMIGRREEDINVDGLPLETRLFDDHGKPTVTIKVTKHKKVNGLPIVDEMESVSESPAGRVISRTECSSLNLECSP